MNNLLLTKYTFNSVAVVVMTHIIDLVKKETEFKRISVKIDGPDSRYSS
jgi:hypothetical protein